MRGAVLLVGGYALCVALAMPAGIAASEAPDPEPGVVTEAEPAQTTTTAPASPGASSYEQPEGSGEEPERGEAEARSAATFAVAMRDIKFKPHKITIGKGDTVEWKNEDEAKHDAIGEDGTFDTPVISKGETSSHTFTKSGSYPYFCSIHQGMDGKITVSSSSSGGGGGGGGSSTDNGSGGISGGGNSTGSSSLDSTSTGSSTSSLASTGEDLVWMGLVGAALLWLGGAVGVIALAQLHEQRRAGR
jgi:plastocyanin